MIAVYLVQDGRFTYVNPKLADIFGCSQEEVLAAPSVLDFIAEADHALVVENFRRRLSGEIQTAQYEFRCAAGTASWSKWRRTARVPWSTAGPLS
jgi:PAS domain S-box-containing protein